MRKDIEDNLLRMRKGKFLEIVHRTAHTLNVKIPKVVFWEKDCPNYSGKELAHIHIETQTICIAEIDLKDMSFDEIEEVASHEVTHLTDNHPESNDVHSVDFYNRHSKAQTLNFRPPGGTTVITESNSRTEEKTTKVKPKINKKICHICGENQNLSECEYCKRYFCEIHIKALEPGSFIGNNSRLFINREKPKNDNFHPCANYVDFLAEKKKMQDERWGIELDILTGRKKYIEVKETYFPEYVHSNINEDKREPKSTRTHGLYTESGMRIGRKPRRENIPVKDRKEYNDTVIIKPNNTGIRKLILKIKSFFGLGR